MSAEAYHERESRMMMMIIRNFYLLLYIFNKLDGINYKHDNIDGLFERLFDVHCLAMMWL